MTHAVISAIAHCLPEGVLTNDQLAAMDAKWTPDAIKAKTWIEQRHIAARSECASDLAVNAARELLATSGHRTSDIDYLLFCTQSPDYLLPTTACLVQDRLRLPTSCGALDVNLGCSGFVYCLGLAKGLIATGQARHVLLITADTYSKYLHTEDLHVRTVFGDAAAATLIVATEEQTPLDGESIGPFVYGTDGRGARNLIVPESGLRHSDEAEDSIATSPARNGSSRMRLVMDGPEIFRFTIEAVPAAINSLLERTNLSLDDIQLFVFHQANGFMLEHLRKKIGIPEDRFYVAMRYCGNTVSASIPIALKHAAMDGCLRRGDRVILVGFGVGYSWAATLLRWMA